MTPQDSAAGPLLAFAGATPMKEPEYRYERDPDHPWAKRGSVEVYKRHVVGPGAGFQRAVCGIFAAGSFVPLAQAFPDQFPKK